MRLAGTASPLRRKGRPRRQSRDGLWSAPQASALVCPAGVEPAISGAQSRRGGQSPLQAEVKNGPKSSRLVEPRPGVGQSDVGVTEALRGSGNRVGAGVSRELLRPRPGVGHGDENVTRLPQPFRSALIEIIMPRRSRAGLRWLLRWQGSNLRLAINSRVSYRSTTPERKAEGEGVEPPRPKPTRFRDGIPRQMAVLPTGDPGRTRTCTTPIKSRALYRIELRSQDVVGRARTCNAPRFRRALYLL